MERPANPIALPPGGRPPGWSPPGSRPPGWRPPSYTPPYPRPPHWHWGDYYWNPAWGWFFTGALAGTTLAFIDSLPDDECRQTVYEGETLYLCGDTLFRPTYYQDEKVYEIVSPGRGEAAGRSGPVRLTSPRMTGDRVRDVQKALTREGHAIAVDGVFGKGSDGALREFQAARGLSVTGEVDEATAKALGL
ncbi:peptidoglycan-binding domain-containing protein [Alsobacter sp. R-9]